MAILFAIFGAVWGMIFEPSGNHIYGAGMGGVLGFVLGRVLMLQSKLDRLMEMKGVEQDKPDTKQDTLSVPEPEKAVKKSAVAMSAPGQEPKKALKLEAQAPDDKKHMARSRDQQTQKKKDEQVGRALQPTGAERAFEKVRRLIVEGNTPVQVGMVVLIIGIALLFRYVGQHIHFPIEYRLLSVALASLVLLAIGWHLREKRRDYALIVQGGALGMLYLTIFAAFRLYPVLPSSIAFAGFFCVAVACVVLALMQKALPIAFAGTAAGFMAPILASTGSGNHVALFSYYAILNASIFVIGWKYAWRSLNMLGFASTFIIATIWGGKYYLPENFATVEPFLIIFFLMYFGIQLLYAWRQEPKLKGAVDGIPLFGLPIIVLLHQAKLVLHIDKGFAVSAAVMALFYLLTAYWMHKKGPQWLGLMKEVMAGLGVVLANLAVIMSIESFDDLSAVWAIEGAGLVWLGLRQSRVWLQSMAVILEVCASLSHLAGYIGAGTTVFVFNPEYMGAIIIVGASLWTAWCYARACKQDSRIYRILARLFLVWGVLWWYIASLNEIVTHHDYEASLIWSLMLANATSIAFYVAGYMLRWHALGKVALVLIPVAWFILYQQFMFKDHPFAGIWLGIWAITVLTWIGLGYAVDHRKKDANRLGPVLVLFFWFVIVLLGLETKYWLGVLNLGAAWTQALTAIVIMLLLAPMLFAERIKLWPFRAYLRELGVTTAAPLVMLLLTWMLMANITLSGDVSPVAYVPLANPLDIASLLVLAAFMRWSHLLNLTNAGRIKTTQLLTIIGALAFIWINALMIRSLHHYAGVPFEWSLIVRSSVVHVAASLLWAMLALVAMFYGTLKEMRNLWIGGAVLLGVTVAKLFFVDISNIGTIARIVSFIGVGVLMLAIGYFAPVPPVKKEEATTG